MFLSRWFGALLAWLSWMLGVRTRKAEQIGEGQTVAVVGAGFAGVNLAHYLAASTAYRVILLDKKDYFEYTPSMLHLMVNPSKARVTHAPYDELSLLAKPSIALRTGPEHEVVRLTDRALQTRGGEWIKFDKLALAVGSDYHHHIKPDTALTFPARLSQIDSMASELAQAQRVQIFGAGLVGLELAAEIAETYPDKHVTLRSREPTVLPDFPPSARRYVHRWLEGRGVHIVCNNAIPPHRAEVSGPKGEELVYNCTGLRPIELRGVFKSKEQPEAKVPNGKGSNGSAHPALGKIPAGYGKQLDWERLVEPRGQLLRADRHLHLEGYSNIFVLGDILLEHSLPPPMRAGKLAFQAELQAWVVSENLKRQAEGRPEWIFPQHVAKSDVCPTLVVCSLGVWDGVVLFNQWMLGGKIAALAKVVLERSKMALLRGWFWAELMWTVAEPSSLLLNRFVRSLQRCGRKSKEA